MWYWYKSTQMAEVIKTVNSNILSGYGINKNYRTLLGGVKIN